MLGHPTISPVGRMIEGYASNSNLKTIALELGGKLAMIVFDDADLDMAISLTHTATFLRVTPAGQY
jgi:acyl-CoA reductase-like NAD-dependent aldehyde dehydrogenase